jgi:hypothetical protein
MRRRNRVALTVVALTACVGAIVGLASLGTASRGPLSSLLDRLGAAFGSAEYAARRRVRGSERSASLAWFDAYRSNADRLRRPDVVLLGAYDDGLPRTLDGAVALETSLHTVFPLLQVYAAWGDKPEEEFPQNVAQTIWNLGSVPVITWEPWLADFENARHPELPLREARDRHGLAGVARGDYDQYVDRWAAAAARFAHPLLLRFGHEMNDPYRYPWGPQNNTKEEYIAAWRHVVDRFRAAGARNVLWVWSPHVAYEYWELYYPGDAYVDWVATGVLNFGPIAQWSRWWSFDEIFGKKYVRLASFRKPVMIAELGSLAVGGDRPAWYSAALQPLPAREPAVHAVLFFNAKEDQTTTYQKVDWTVTDDSATAAAIRQALASWKRPPLAGGVDHR